jgi:hypothetical protein
VLVAVTSVFVAPRVQRRLGTVPAVLVTLVLFMLDLLMMAIFAEHQGIVITGIVLSGAFIGTSNTLITETVMGVAPVERPVASRRTPSSASVAARSGRTSPSSCSVFPRTSTRTHHSSSAR